MTSRMEISSGGAREHVAAARAARAANDPGAAKPQQDLLDVVGGQPLARGDLAPGDRALVRATGEMQRADQRRTRPTW